jgi:S-adenosylmethionine hydrolase
MKSTSILILCCFVHFVSLSQPSRPLVLQTDFGTKDGAVAAMKGVALGVDDDLRIFDLTHEIPPYNIWEGAYRLNQTATYWPSRTVFVSVVDPGVGSERKSIALLTKKGQIFVSPDNGTLTLIAESEGIAEVRLIDETTNRLPGSSESYTFHGRDVYAYTGARLASGKIRFQDVGPVLGGDIVRINYQKAESVGKQIRGTIDVLDVQYGNVWTNIPKSLIDKLGITYGDRVDVQILESGVVKYQKSISFGKTFSDVGKGEPVAYLNSLLNFSIGINLGDFARQESIGSGNQWQVIISKSKAAK